MKDSLRSKHMASDKEVKTTVMKWLKEQLTEFYKAGNIAVVRNGDHIKK